jgi:GNAT superfamily N-acetyltransferase
VVLTGWYLLPRGQGLGSALLDALEDRARTSGSARLALDISAKNHAARRFYDRHGLTVESQWPRHLPIPGLRLLRLTKPL